MKTNEATLRALAHEAIDHADADRLEDVIAILDDASYSEAEIERIDSMLSEGFASGPSEEMTRGDWARLREVARMNARAE